MKCLKCNTKINLFWSFCPICGKTIENKRIINVITLISIALTLLFGYFHEMYGAMIVISLILNASILYTLCKKQNYSNFEIWCLLVYELIGMIIGAKLLTYITHYNEYKDLSFLEIGLSSYGGAIGTLIMIFIYQFQFKKDKKILFVNCLLPLPLMYAVGKVGCFIAGCCYGIEYSGPFNIVYKNSLEAPNGVGLFPVQIVESIIFFLIFIYLFFNKKLSYVNKCGLLFILCGSAKFLLDFLRASHIGILISVNQIISIIFVTIGIILIKQTMNEKSKL